MIFLHLFHLRCQVIVSFLQFTQLCRGSRFTLTYFPKFFHEAIFAFLHEDQPRVS